jgi:hypothetical protein
LKPKLTVDNKGSLELANGSKISAESTTSDSARSESLSLLIIDEAAIIDTHKVDDLWSACYPTLSMGGSATIISTPKGVGNWYHKMWKNAINKENEFNTIITHWSQHPIYSENISWKCAHEHKDVEGRPMKKCNHVQSSSSIFAPICEVCGNPTLKPSSPWYEEQKRQLGDYRKLAQEFDLDFLGSGDQVINPEILRKQDANICRPIEVTAFDGNLWVWEDADLNHEYLLCADVARGDGEDFSAFHVFKFSDRLEQVAEYKGKIPPDIYAKLIFATGEKYNNACVVVEANNIGYATALKLKELNYPNQFHSMPGQFSATRSRKNIEKALMDKDSMVPGFQTTITSRPLAVAQFEETMRNSQLIIRSTRFMSEIETFIWHNGKPQAMHGYNDDLCMAASIGLLVINVALDEVTKFQKSRISVLENISRFSTKSTDMEILNISHTSNNNPWLMPMIDGTVEDLTWLIG